MQRPLSSGLRVLVCVLAMLGCGLFFAARSEAASPRVKIKNIAHILEARDNQLMGFGLVVGLRNSGDKTSTGFTQQALTNLLSRMGVVPQSVDFKSRNVAAVMVTAILPPFVKPGQKIDVNVASMGDATSLQGGTLLLTPLQGVDDQTYATAQGSITVGIEPQTPNLPYVKQTQSTVGIITEGALVEKEIPVSLQEKGMLTIVVDSPDFTTADRIASAIRNKGYDAGAKDAGTVIVSLGEEDVVSMIANIENLSIVPDTIAKIVVNERTGTIVIGENVVISPVAVSYAGLDISIGDMSLYSYGGYSSSDFDDNANSIAYTTAHLQKNRGKMKIVPASPTLSVLVRALNAVGASPKDLIAILQAMKRAGAIKAELEVI